MSAQLITVATFDTPIDAEIAKGKLEAVGVRVFLADEATVRMASYLGPAMGGVKLQVRDNDVELWLSDSSSNSVRAHSWRSAICDSMLVTSSELGQPSRYARKRSAGMQVFGSMVVLIGRLGRWGTETEGAIRQPGSTSRMFNESPSSYLTKGA